MKISRAGKQQKACWRSEARCEAHWSRELIDYVTLQAMLRGHIGEHLFVTEYLISTPAVIVDQLNLKDACR